MGVDPPSTNLLEHLLGWAIALAERNDTDDIENSEVLIKAAGEIATLRAAINHLGAVLSTLAELAPCDRSSCLDEALSFYNATKPNSPIYPEVGYVTRLVRVGPLDWPPSDAKF